MSDGNGRLRLFPNVGGEEPGGPEHAAARAAARLWRLLFRADAEWPDDERADWPGEISAAGDTNAFDWLPDAGLCAWWNDAAAADEARRAGLSLVGASPEAIARTHDKAFAARFADANGWTPRSLRGRIVVYEADALRDADAFRSRLRADLARWPDGLAATAVLKPRLGTSGRGRVRVADVDADDWVGALPRLAARGGALLEPWLERQADYSVQLHVAPDGARTLLGTLGQMSGASGAYRAHFGEIDHRGRVGCGAGVDDRLIEAAMDLADAAHAAGHHGPCGVDAFAFRDGERSTLRPIVEFNARFTMGTVALGLLRRARTWIDGRLPPEPGERRSFVFAFGNERRPDDDETPRLAFAEGAAELRLRRGPVEELLSRSQFGS